jgi:hypothetical protein
MMQLYNELMEKTRDRPWTRLPNYQNSENLLKEADLAKIASYQNSEHLLKEAELAKIAKAAPGMLNPTFTSGMLNLNSGAGRRAGL